MFKFLSMQIQKKKKVYINVNLTNELTRNNYLPLWVEKKNLELLVEILLCLFAL